jgi:hypothetical protein
MHQRPGEPPSSKLVVLRAGAEPPVDDATLALAQSRAPVARHAPAMPGTRAKWASRVKMGSPCSSADFPRRPMLATERR